MNFTICEPLRRLVGIFSRRTPEDPVTGAMKPWRTAEEIFRAALREADPAVAVRRHAEEIRSLYLEQGFERLIAIGFGKASFPMARAVEETLGDLLEAGAIITKYGHSSGELRKFRVFEVGHPVPDGNGVAGTGELVRLLKDVTPETLVVNLISGGGSALLVSPCDGILLEDKRRITSQLLLAGADITELNTVRKHLSRVKGGRLAELAFPATIVSLILSDVIGDKLDVIASGPTAPDSSSYTDALSVLEKYGLMEKAPVSVVKHLVAGEKGLLPETPEAESPVFRNVRNTIIGSNRLAIEAARDAAESIGLETRIIEDILAGEARKAGRWLGRKALVAKLRHEGKCLCLLSGGETTVTVTGNGKGGRNMELALAFAQEIDGTPGITLLSAGTDGGDGPTDAAGAVVDGMTLIRAGQKGLDADEYLRDNDSYNFFRETGGLFVTGPTGTNVMDIQIVVIE